MFQAIQPQDPAYMRLALQLAAAARYRTSPNPSVGCVLVKDGQVIGEGATQAVGGDHGEIDALKNAAALGHDVRGATAYVTLEPCNHKGRTGPCSAALLAAGIARVVAAIEDPNPLTAGAGLRTLQAAGVVVSLGVCAQEAAALNIGFIKRMVSGLPWVRLKVATSLDGFVALPNGQSQWLTGEAARLDAHHERATACAVATGIGTLLADDPRLDVRHVATPRQPQRVVFDTHLRTPPSAAILASRLAGGSAVHIFHASGDANKTVALRSAGAQLHPLPLNGEHLDLGAALIALGKLGINTVHLECGSQLNSAFLNAGLVDEVLLYQAPMLLGAGLPWAAHSRAYTHLDQAPRWRLQSTTRLGADAKLVLHTPHTFQWNP